MPDLTVSPRLRALLAGRVPLLVLTGAGVSAESGLATFRGPGGLWEGRSAQDLATPAAFARDPAEVWRFYRWRRAQAAAAAPNAGHRALARLQAAHGAMTLVTQNVDGLHQRAGSRDVVELHGSLWILRCTREGLERRDEDVSREDSPPRCACGALERPGVVWFGEPLDRVTLARADAAARAARLVIVAGTSSLVHPAAALPLVAKEHGACVVEVNPEVTPLTSHADERLAGPSGVVLPLLVEAAGLVEARA